MQQALPQRAVNASANGTNPSLYAALGIGATSALPRLLMASLLPASEVPWKKSMDGTVSTDSTILPRWRGKETDLGS